MRKNIALTAMAATLALGACATTLTPEAEARLLADVAPEKRPVLEAAGQGAPGSAVGQLLVGVLFASQCEGIWIDEPVGRYAEAKLDAFKKEGGDIETEALKQAIAAFAESHDVDPVDLKDPPIGCPIAEEEIDAGTLTGVLLTREEPAS
ncbi:hypothetical protein [Mangrovicoccus algicola]|uniref:Lipoprotein n=1 Tax=Mangrovicoccus algicola TaxID=2771008 RepID=A0A8J6YVQ4_9RHOB|nr:hypothetical protein [Mangrovicoccus algicola]MBE3638725.1 hypothetical protein [Mangrovicoccus algicola]